MTPPNFTQQGADVALDPMAGTLASTGRIVYSPDFQSEQRNIHGSIQASDSFARAPTFDLEKINTDVADPWARDGAQTPPDASPRRANAGSTVAPSVGLNVNILALDLGTKLGWAMLPRGGQITHGTESFAPRKSWSPGQRWQRFRSFLHEVVARHNVHVIAYEDVKRHVGTDAAHAYGAFLALTELVADSHRVRLVPVGVGTIKKHWTGKGNADKGAMIAQARARGFRPDTDNDADALAILHWAVDQERKA